MTDQGRRWSRARAALAAAVLGLLTQAVVAWGIAWRHNPRRHTEIGMTVLRPAGSASPVDRMEVLRYESWGRVWITVVATAGTSGFAHARRHPGTSEELVRPWRPGQVYPPLGDPDLWPMTLTPATKAREVALLRADGWPMVSLWHRYSYNPARPMPYDQVGAVNTPWLRARDPMVGTLPLALAWRPVWGGLAVNTAVYGAAWWGLLVTPGRVRRQRRGRRGLCLGCGYDLRGAPGARCPECGRDRV